MVLVVYWHDASSVYSFTFCRYGFCIYWRNVVSFFLFLGPKIARLLSLLKATVLTFLSAGFLIPFIQQSRAQELKVPLGKN